MRVELLLKELELVSRRNQTDIINELAPRKLKELEFHDTCRDSDLVHEVPEDTYEKLHGNKKYYRTVTLSTDYVDTWIKEHCKGKIFLDFACGNGANAIKAAKTGASLAIGIDISRISVNNAKTLAAQSHLSNTFFMQADCENTNLPSNCIDIAVCSGMLHHLDLSYAFYELRRILKPGGIILAVEALDYNPIIKLYRNMTPAMRTEWEKNHILSYKDILFASRFFSIREIKHWHLFSIAGVYFPRLLPFFNQIDMLVLRIPGFKLLSWMFTFEMHKEIES